MKDRLNTGGKFHRRFTRRKISIRRKKRSKDRSNFFEETAAPPSPKFLTKDDVQKQANSILELVKEEERLPKEEDEAKITYRFYHNGNLYEVNFFKEGAYNGPRASDFYDRKALLERTALNHLKNLYGIREHATIERLSHKLDNDLKALPQNLSESSTKDIDKATQLIAQYAKDLQWIVQQKDETFTMDKFRQLEKELILSRGRPIIMNLFSLPDPADENKTKKFISIHHPVDPGGRTIPSSLRDRPGLANYIATSFGEVDSEDNVSISFQAVRHGIYTPLQVPQKIKREAIAAQNVKQALVYVAKGAEKGEGEGKSKGNPIEVEIRDVLLLTALRADKLRNRSKGIAGKWKGYSESTQLRETARALNLYKDRPIQLEIDGEKVWVKPNISFFNLGANEWASIKPFMQKALYTQVHYDINARGFNEFERDILHFLKDAKEEAELAIKTEEVIHREAKLQAKKQRIQPQLDEIYAQLDQLYQDYLTPGTHANTKEIDRLKKRAERLEAKLYKEWRKLEKAEKKEYKQVNAALQNILKQELPSIEKDLLQNLIDAREVYFSGKTADPAEVKTVQNLVIQSQSLMGRTVKFFCKSAEDRTGNLENETLAREAYRLMAGHNPTTRQEDHAMREKLYPLLHQYSASLNTARENADSRGLQTTPNVNPYLDKKQVEAGKKVATLAKNIPRIAKTLQPSREAIELLGP